MVLYMYLAKTGWSVLPMVHMCGDSFLSRKEVERANEGVKRVLGNANQDKKVAIQFFPDCGAPSVLEDVMALFDFVRLHLDHASSTRTLLVFRPGTLCRAAACFMVM